LAKLFLFYFYIYYVCVIKFDVREVVTKTCYDSWEFDDMVSLAPRLLKWIFLSLAGWWTSPYDNA